MKFTVKVYENKIRQVTIDADREVLAALHDWLADMPETPNRNELCRFLTNFLIAPDADVRIDQSQKLMDELWSGGVRPTEVWNYYLRGGIPPKEEV
jgi:hypothetical protein